MRKKNLFTSVFFSCVAIYTRAKSVFLWFVVLSSGIQKENNYSFLLHKKPEEPSPPELDYSIVS